MIKRFTVQQVADGGGPQNSMGFAEQSKNEEDDHGNERNRNSLVPDDRFVKIKGQTARVSPTRIQTEVPFSCSIFYSVVLGSGISREHNDGYQGVKPCKAD